MVRRVPGREDVGKAEGVGGMRSSAGGSQGGGEAWGFAEHGSGEAEGLLRLEQRAYEEIGLLGRVKEGGGVQAHLVGRRGEGVGRSV